MNRTWNTLVAGSALGVLTTIGIAWVSVATIDLSHAAPTPRQFHSNAAAPAWLFAYWQAATAEGVLSIDSSLSGAARTEEIASGPSWSRTRLPPRSVPGEEYSARYEDARGWPMLALVSVQVSSDMSLTTWRTRSGVPLPSKSGIYDVSRALGWTPIWPGFLVNSALFSALWSAVVAVLFFAIARRRIRRGLCAHCGYSIAGLSRCPECGLEPSHPVPR